MKASNWEFLKQLANQIRTQYQTFFSGFLLGIFIRKKILLNCDLPLENIGFPVQVTPRSQTSLIVGQDTSFKQTFKLLVVQWKGNC